MHQGLLKPSLPPPKSAYVKRVTELGSKIAIEEATGLPPARKPKLVLRSRHGDGGRAKDVLPAGEARSKPNFQANIPAFHSTVSIDELGAYIVNTSYIVSFVRPPLSDVKYGIIFVPVSDASELFGPRSHAVSSPDFIETVKDADSASSADLRLHEMTKGSLSFLPRCFEDDFAERPAESHGNVEFKEPRDHNASQAFDVGGLVKGEEDAEPAKVRRAREVSEDARGTSPH